MSSSSFLPSSQPLALANTQKRSSSNSIKTITRGESFRATTTNESPTAIKIRTRYISISSNPNSPIPPLKRDLLQPLEARMKSTSTSPHLPNTSKLSKGATFNASASAVGSISEDAVLQSELPSGGSSDSLLQPSPSSSTLPLPIPLPTPVPTTTSTNRRRSTFKNRASLFTRQNSSQSIISTNPIYKILSQETPTSLKQNQIDTLLSYFNKSTDVGRVQKAWGVMSNKERCAIMRFCRVRQSLRDESFVLSECNFGYGAEILTGGGERENNGEDKGGGDGAMYFMIHGQATLSITSSNPSPHASPHSSLSSQTVVNDTRNHIFNPGQTFGYFPTSPQLNETINNKLKIANSQNNLIENDTNRLMNNLKVIHHREKTNSTKLIISIPKGSSYIILPSSDILPVFKGLFKRLSVMSVLRNVGLEFMAGRGVDVVNFEKGWKLVSENEKQGKYVYVVVEGECLMTKCTSDDDVVGNANNHHHASGDFSGVNDGDYDDNENENEPHSHSHSQSHSQLPIESTHTPHYSSSSSHQIKRTKNILLPSGHISSLPISNISLIGPNSFIGEIGSLLSTTEPCTVTVISAKLIALRFPSLDFVGRVSSCSKHVSDGFRKRCVEKLEFVKERYKMSDDDVVVSDILGNKKVEDGQGEVIRENWDRGKLRENYENDVGECETSFGTSSSLKSRAKTASIASPSLSISKRTNTAIFTPQITHNQVISIDDLTLDLSFSSRQKLHPKFKKNYFITELKRRLLKMPKRYERIEWADPGDPFVYFEFIDLTKHKSDVACELRYDPSLMNNNPESLNNNDLDDGEFDVLSPYPTITQNRTLHGRPLPLLVHSEGYKCPHTTFSNYNERLQSDRNFRRLGEGSGVKRGEREVIEHALEVGFVPYADYHGGVKNEASGSLSASGRLNVNVGEGEEFSIYKNRSKTAGQLSSPAGRNMNSPLNSPLSLLSLNTTSVSADFGFAKSISSLNACAKRHGSASASLTPSIWSRNDEKRKRAEKFYCDGFRRNVYVDVVNRSGCGGRAVTTLGQGHKSVRKSNIGVERGRISSKARAKAAI